MDVAVLCDWGKKSAKIQTKSAQASYHDSSGHNDLIVLGLGDRRNDRLDVLDSPSHSNDLASILASLVVIRVALVIVARLSAGAGSSSWCSGNSGSGDSNSHSHSSRRLRSSRLGGDSFSGDGFISSSARDVFDSSFGGGGFGSRSARNFLDSGFGGGGLACRRASCSNAIGADSHEHGLNVVNGHG